MSSSALRRSRRLAARALFAAARPALGRRAPDGRVPIPPASVRVAARQFRRPAVAALDLFFTRHSAHCTGARWHIAFDCTILACRSLRLSCRCVDSHSRMHALFIHHRWARRLPTTGRPSSRAGRPRGDPRPTRRPRCRRRAPLSPGCARPSRRRAPTTAPMTTVTMTVAATIALRAVIRATNRIAKIGPHRSQRRRPRPQSRSLIHCPSTSLAPSLRRVRTRMR
jgi:hypothetical protein